MGRPRVLQLLGRWKPQLGFYEIRAPFLKALDDRGALLKFRMPDDRVEAVVADVGFVDVGPGHIQVFVGSPTFDYDHLLETLGNALGAFDDAPSGWTGRVKHISEIDASYDDARLAGVAGWLHTDEEVTDLAVLVDGRDRETGYTYQCEYGVISRDEAELRLVRAGRGKPHEVPIEIDTSGLPPVAVFLDWNWSSPQSMPINILASGTEVLDRCITLSETHSARIHTKCVDNLPTLNLQLRK